MDNVSSIIRQIKIDMITEYPNKILQYFDNLWMQLDVIETNVFHSYGGEYIYYLVNDDGVMDWIFFCNKNDDELWCNYKSYTRLFFVNFGLMQEEVEHITVFLLKGKIINIRGITPISQPMCSIITKALYSKL